MFIIMLATENSPFGCFGKQLNRNSINNLWDSSDLKEIYYLDFKSATMYIVGICILQSPQIKLIKVNSCSIKLNLSEEGRFMRKLFELFYQGRQIIKGTPDFQKQPMRICQKKTLKFCSGNPNSLHKSVQLQFSKHDKFLIST